MKEATHHALPPPWECLKARQQPSLFIKRMSCVHGVETEPSDKVDEAQRTHRTWHLLYTLRILRQSKDAAL